MASKNKEPLISIVVPIYNVADFLPRCLDSIFAQTYKTLEIILVDDGSTDDSGKLCDAYKKKDRRIVVIHKKNGGLSDARNAGTKAAKGEYISFVDPDDYIDSDYVAYLYRSISKNDSDISACGHTSIYPETNSEIKSSSRTSLELNSHDAINAILCQKYNGFGVSAWAKLYRTDLARKNLFPKGRLFEDTATIYKLVDGARRIQLDLDSKYNYIMRSGSIVNAEFDSRKLDIIRSTEEMCDYVIKKYPDLKDAARSRLIYANLSTLMQLSRSGIRNRNAEKRLIGFVRKNGFSSLFKKTTPNRDKLGIICCYPGFHFFKFAWGVYSKITGRKV